MAERRHLREAMVITGVRLGRHQCPDLNPDQIELEVLKGLLRDSPSDPLLPPTRILLARLFLLGSSDRLPVHLPRAGFILLVHLLNDFVEGVEERSVEVVGVAVVDVAISTQVLVDPQPAVGFVRAAEADAEVPIFQHVRAVPARKQIRIEHALAVKVCEVFAAELRADRPKLGLQADEVRVSVADVKVAV